MRDYTQWINSWDSYVGQSNYHFDNFKKDKPGEWFRVLGKFNAPSWKHELELIASRLSPLVAGPEVRQPGAPPPANLELTQYADKIQDCPTLMAMYNYIGLIGGSVSANGTVLKGRRIHWQMPGQTFLMHLDRHWEQLPDKNKPQDVARITVMLEDWQPGQFIMYGNCIYDHWQAGEIHVFDWVNTPHCTANASRFPRPTFQMTGLVSEKTKQLLNTATPESVHNL